MSRHSMKLQSLRILVLAMVTATLALGLPMTAFAADVRSGNTVVVPAGQTVNDDVYAFGTNVIIEGTVNGDVIAAGSTVTINGHVTGDVIAAGNTITVAAPVGGTVRAAGNLVTISGAVAGDALAAGSILTLNTSGSIGRDVLAAGNSITLAGAVGRDLKATANTLTVSSSVGGSVQAQVSDLVLGAGAAVQGPISYMSNKDLSIAPGAQIQGLVQRTAAPTRTPNPWVIGGIDLLGLIRGFVGLAAFGIVLALLFPRATKATAETVQQQWLASLGLGFGVLVGLPVLAVLLGVVGAVIGGWWIGVMLLGAYLLLAVLGYLAFAEWVGMTAARYGNWTGHPVWSLLIGLAIVGLVTLIPFIGPLVGFVAVVLGLGAFTLTAWSAYRPAPVATGLPVSTAAATPLPVAA
jgi:cytoskeletal protein CcmA (bactofilin family)